MVASLITTVVSTYALVFLLRDNDVSWVIPHTQPLVLLLTIIKGYFVFHEKLTPRQLLGAMCIVMGVLLLQQ